ncbi:MAG: hypothetical protein JRF63_00870 [Deltaproteobacteria bacterium]|nr:hypothetical protein [Deltaproteobacteria bacterium]
METPFIRQPITSQVRRFLADQGVSVEPWSGLEETYQRLHGLLGERLDDREFWSSLGGFVEGIAASVRGEGSNNRVRLSAPGAELLSSRDADRLVRDLRRALGDARNGGGRASLSRFLGRLEAPAMAAFVLLALAAVAGCSETEAAAAQQPAQPVVEAVDEALPIAPSAEVEAEPPEPWDVGCSLERDDQLFAALERSSLEDSERQVLCDCFTAMNERWDRGLSRLFKRGDPERIAKTLERLIECCEGGAGELDANCKDVKRRFVKRSIVQSHALYKGVAFPPEA